jgi:hypothetical protein
MGSRLDSRIVFLRPVNVSNASTAFHSQLQLSLLRPSVPTTMSTGILTCFPSTTPFGLALGPDSPPMDEPCGGTLRFSGHWILTNVFVTQADILTSTPSTNAYALASPDVERSPTDSFSCALGPAPFPELGSFFNGGPKRVRKESHSFGRPLSPGHYRRKNALPVSYYALFKGLLLLQYVSLYTYKYQTSMNNTLTFVYAVLE